MFYAIEAVLYIAYNSTGNCVSSKEIAEKQKMLPRYLEQIMQKLVRVGLLKGVRGPAGGYLLAREKRRITIADICRAMHEEEPVQSSTPLGDKIVMPLIKKFQESIIKQMEEVTISELCQQAAEKNIRKSSKETNNFTI